MARVTFHLRRDADGMLVGEGIEEGANVTLATIQARQPAGVSVLDARTAPRPPEPPDPLRPKRERLAALRVKGWAALTLAEKEEARALRFDLGGDTA